MNGETKEGVSTISLERLQCAGWDSAGSIEEVNLLLLLIRSNSTPCFDIRLPSSGACECLIKLPSEDGNRMPKHVGVELECINNKKIRYLIEHFWSSYIPYLPLFTWGHFFNF
jgi:hypothetical protein